MRSTGTIKTCQEIASKFYEINEKCGKYNTKVPCKNRYLFIETGCCYGLAGKAAQHDKD